MLFILRAPFLWAKAPLKGFVPLSRIYFLRHCMLIHLRSSTDYVWQFGE